MGAYVELDSLVALQFKAGGFTLNHNQPVHSLLFGRRASHVRGRGLDFEELRSYVAGDDVPRLCPPSTSLSLQIRAPSQNFLLSPNRRSLRRSTKSVFGSATDQGFCFVLFLVSRLSSSPG